MAEFATLPAPVRSLFTAAVARFVGDLQGGQQPRASLRVKRVLGHPGVWEMSGAAGGRATFEYGDEVSPGQRRIVWRRIGSHDIFRNP